MPAVSSKLLSFSDVVVGPTVALQNHLDKSAVHHLGSNWGLGTTITLNYSKAGVHMMTVYVIL